VHAPLKLKKRQLKLAVTIAILLPSLTHPAFADVDESIENLLKFGQSDARYGRITFDLNYRYEHADTENTAPKPANANTFRLRLGYLTPDFHGVQGFAEYEDVYAAQTDFNGITAGDPSRQVVADPADRHELNQLWLSFKFIPDTLIKGGRQRIKLDDDRFIGNVGWRQMEQTFDSVMVTNTSLDNLTLKAGYIGRVRTITSLIDNIEAPFANINYNFGNLGNVTGYGYWLHFTEDAANVGKSSQSYGLRWLGSPKINDALTLHYTAEYSFQADYQNNPADFSLDRYNIMGGLTVFGVTVKGALEQLDGNGRSAFQTPLGTNHAFQGWADRFLVTPKDGIRDVNVSLATTLLASNWVFVYHNFKDDTGSVDYGNEYDVLVTRALGKHYSVLAKYAFYDGDSTAPGALKNDMQKIWVQANVSF